MPWCTIFEGMRNGRSHDVPEYSCTGGTSSSPVSGVPLLQVSGYFILGLHLPLNLLAMVISRLGLSIIIARYRPMHYIACCVPVAGVLAQCD